ncbi:MAG: hypothetical protein JW760_11010 [Spirochaetales bacterium]|nr:hypothetical protein [Spirochaetales bacterium]
MEDDHTILRWMDQSQNESISVGYRYLFKPAPVLIQRLIPAARDVPMQSFNMAALVFGCRTI